MFLPSFQRGTERAFVMIFSRSFLIACIDCKEISAVASWRETSSIQTELAILIASGMDTSFLQSLDDFEMSLAEPMQWIASRVAIGLC